MDGAPIDKLRPAQFNARKLFWLLTASAFGIALFRWLPSRSALIVNLAGCLTIALVVYKSSPILRNVLLTLTFTLSMALLLGPSVVKDGWSLPTAFVGLSVALFVAVGVIEVWRAIARRRDS